MTLPEHIACGYVHYHHAGPDPAPLCAAEIPREELEAERVRLDVPAVLAKDHVTRVKLAFVKRVLEIVG